MDNGPALSSTGLDEPWKRALISELHLQLPRLVFAAIDRFPLAGGERPPAGEATGQISILAVRATPVAERLDRDAAQQLNALVSAVPVQSHARRLELLVEGAGVAIISWHDVADFAALLLRGNPSCAEAVASSETPLFAGQEWAALRALFGPAECNALLASKPYRNACVGAAMKLMAAGRQPKANKKMQQSQEKGEADQKQKPHEQGKGTRSAIVEAEEKVTSATNQQKELVLGLCRRACDASVGNALRARLEDLTTVARVSKEQLFALASDLMQATKEASHAATELPCEAVGSWVDEVLLRDFQAFSIDCLKESPPADTLPVPQHSPLDLPADWLKRLSTVWPPGAELVFLAQSGSFLYDLHVPSSDSDFSIVYLSRVRDVVGRVPPATYFAHHVNAGFASDKRGEIEYSGKEMGSFLVELAKGNPRNVELLFTEKPHLANSVWQDLRARRRSFLTLPCASQYLGFISDRLHKAAAEIECDDARSFEEAAGKRFSKLLYHAYHKIFELRRVLQGAEPAVALTGSERDFVMELRLRPPASAHVARRCLEEAEKSRAELSDKLDAARASGALPGEVDVGALVAWMHCVRARQAVNAMASAPQETLALKRTQSVDDLAAIRAILTEIEQAEGIRIVYAGYAASSRTLGTTHHGSDHDVKLVFVLRRSEYFGLREPARTFSRSFPAAGGMAQVDVSGWEARHACKLFAQSNPTILHVLYSPVVFVTSQWTQKLQAAAKDTTDWQKLTFAWLQHGRQNFQTYIRSVKRPIRKKYVHVLRPLLCIEWLRGQSDCQGWPPAPLLELAQEVSNQGGLSATELEAVESLTTQREELPQSLPHNSELDTLVERLIAASPSEGLPQRRMGDAMEDARLARWHDLCVSMVEDMSTSDAGNEGIKPASACKVRAAWP